MQIRAITVNAVDRAAERNSQGSRPQAQPGNNMFGAECRVTISKEGRKLSRQQAAQTEKSTPSVKAERMLLRQQRESELNEDIKNGYREKLTEIEKTIGSLNSSFHKKKDMEETIEKEQEVRRAMRDQKQFQMEENQRRAKEAQQMAARSAGYQEDIDENNRDLLTLLKTIEEAEKAEEERENGEAEFDGGSGGASGTKNSVSDVIRNSAAQFTASSVKREWGVDEAIAGLEETGRWFLDTADSITQNVLKECSNIRAALNDEAFTGEKIAKMMQSFQEGMSLNYKNVENYRGWGLQILQDVREIKIQHIADDPLRGMQETKKSMMQSAADAALGEAMQGGLDETSQELEDEVERLIDERNDVDRIRQGKEEDEEEQARKAEEQARKAEEQAQMQVQGETLRS